jgi:pyrroline-5-carboxylate reductase
MKNLKDQRIFFLGCGKMGSIIALNLVEEAGYKANQITVLKKSDQNQITGFNYIKDCSSLKKGYQADLVFIAVKPQNAAEILSQFSQEKIFHPDTIFISILAGKKLNFFDKFFGKEAKIIRSMPNVPIRDAQGILPYIANKNLNKTELKNLQKLFDNFGQAYELKEEKLFDTTTALFGSGPAYIFYLQKIYADIAIKSGIEKDKAASLVKTLFLGSALTSCNSDLSFSELCDSVTSKAGVTQAALEVLQKDSALDKLFKSAIKSASNRSKELSK